MAARISQVCKPLATESSFLAPEFPRPFLSPPLPRESPILDPCPQPLTL